MLASPSLEPAGVSVVDEPVVEPVAVCSRPGRIALFVGTLLSWFMGPAAGTTAAVLARGAVIPFCLITGSSLLLSRNKRGIGIGCQG